MNPSDVIEGVAALFELASVYLTLYLSALSGYLFVAYTVGKELKPMQAKFVSTIFVVFGLVMIISFFRVNQAGHAFQTAYADDQSVYAGLGSFVILIVELASMIGALIFMLDIRKSNN